MYTMLPFHHMSRTFNDLFDEMERSMFPAQPSGRLPAFRTDIQDQGDHYLLEADLPGFRKEDILPGAPGGQLRPLLRRERHPGGGHLRRL